MESLCLIDMPYDENFGFPAHPVFWGHVCIDYRHQHVERGDSMLPADAATATCPSSAAGMKEQHLAALLT
jgi:hypothetical protein